MSASAAGRVPVSCFIIAFNEADRIGATIDSVIGWVDEVVVVDSGSTDGTDELARRMGCRVVSHAFAGYGPQKRFAEEQCRNDWLLNLDADEVPTQALRDEIAGLFRDGEPAASFYAFRIVLVYPGADGPRPLADGPAPVRLYDRRAGRYAESPVHDRVVIPAGDRTVRLRNVALHRSYRSFSALVDKLNGYSDLQARTFQAEGRAALLARLPFEMPFAFFKYYVVRRHFTGGWRGFVFSTINSFYRMLRVAKLLEARRDGSAGDRGDGR